MGKKLRKTRLKQQREDFNLAEWQLRYLRTGQLPSKSEVNGFAALQFCWSYGAGLTWLKIRNHVQPGEFPYAEENFENWKNWLQVREALQERGED